MKSDGHLLGLTQEVRKQLGKTFWDKVTVKLWEDQEERIVEIPEDVLEVFERTKMLLKCIKNVLHASERIHEMDYQAKNQKPEKTER